MKKTSDLSIESKFSLYSENFFFILLFYLEHDYFKMQNKILHHTKKIRRM